jgi:hypothetical protein
MNMKTLSASLTAVALAGGLTLSAQAQQPPAQQQPATPSMAQAENAVTIVACVQKESDVLRPRMPMTATPGMGDEFVLTNAAMKSDTPAESPATAAAPAQPSTAAANSFGRVYRATGDREKELKQYVGQRVEIVAAFKDAAEAAAATGTSGSAAPSGELTVGNTPELTIQSITPAAGSCAPIVK